jgi:hypothetical protein
MDNRSFSEGESGLAQLAFAFHDICSKSSDFSRNACNSPFSTVPAVIMLFRSRYARVRLQGSYLMAFYEVLSRITDSYA